MNFNQLGISMLNNQPLDTFIRFRKWLSMLDGFKRLRRWLFIGTTFAELFNAIFILGFSLLLIYNITVKSGEIFQLTGYKMFEPFSIWNWFGFLALGFLQLMAMLIPSVRASKASGMCLLLSGAIWAFIAGKFMGGVDSILTTAPIVYMTWAIGVSIAGYERITAGKKLEKFLNKE